jgi:hypothetical protein
MLLQMELMQNFPELYSSGAHYEQSPYDFSRGYHGMSDADYKPIMTPLGGSMPLGGPLEPVPSQPASSLLVKRY